MPERTVKRAIQQLKDCGLIGSYLEHDGGHNHYEFYQHSLMNEPINKNLCYKSDNFTPHAKMARGSAKMARGSAKMAQHKIKEIKENKKQSVGNGETSVSHPPTNISKLKKEKAEENALNDSSIRKLFEEKFAGYNITYEQMFEECREHYETKGTWAIKSKWLRWVQSEHTDRYTKTESHEGKKAQVASLYTEEEQKHLSEYKHWLKTWSKTKTFEEWFPRKDQQSEILKAVAKEEAIIEANKGAMQKEAV